MTEEELKEKARQERNRYYREYRAKNKERVKAAAARSWAKKAAEREGGDLNAEDAPRDPMARTDRATDDIERLKQACFEFALRVLKGENAQPQETAVLPEVLSFLERN